MIAQLAGAVEGVLIYDVKTDPEIQSKSVTGQRPT